LGFLFRRTWSSLWSNRPLFLKTEIFCIVVLDQTLDQTGVLSVSLLSTLFRCHIDGQLTFPFSLLFCWLSADQSPLSDQPRPFIKTTSQHGYAICEVGYCR
jgi:hypothetical protein